MHDPISSVKCEFAAFQGLEKGTLETHLFFIFVPKLGPQQWCSSSIKYKECLPSLRAALW